jgi:DNA-binding response OmpR family regulator
MPQNPDTKTPMHILVIEDETELARHICSALTRHGHDAKAVHDGVEGVQTALAEPPDLIVLDLGLPLLDGFGVLQKLRQMKSPSRVIILTARGEVDQRIKGLKAGAHDYLAKPFAMDELLARVEALGRRTTTAVPSQILKVGDLHLDIHSRKVWRGETIIALSPREFELLQVLMKEPGRVFSRTELSERVWQRDHSYDTRTVEIFIVRVRRKVDAGFSVPLIHTMRSVGYTIKA